MNFRTGAADDGSDDTFQGFDTVVGSAGSDRLVGAAGEQWFVPWYGDDKVNGAGGRDVITYLIASSPVTVRLDAQDPYSIGEGTDSLTSFEAVIGSLVRDHIYGGPGGEYLLGYDGNDYISGGGGNNTIEGNAGGDDCFDAVVYVSCENQPDSLVYAPTPEPPPGGPPDSG